MADDFESLPEQEQLTEPGKPTSLITSFREWWRESIFAELLEIPDQPPMDEWF